MESEERVVGRVRRESDEPPAVPIDPAFFVAALAVLDGADQWSDTIRRLIPTAGIAPAAVEELLTLWCRATSTSPSQRWLRRDGEIRDAVGAVTVEHLAAVLLEAFVATTLDDESRSEIRTKNAAAHDLLRTMAAEAKAKREGTLAYLGASDADPVAAWAASVNPRIDALPGSMLQGALFSVAHGDLLRGAVWAAGRSPSDPGHVAAMLEAVVEHGVQTNVGLEPGTEVIQAGKAVNAAIVALATLPDAAGRASLGRLSVSIAHGQHAKAVSRALAAVEGGPTA